MLNVHDLVEVTGGQLCLASLPPLEGVCGRVPRIVLDSQLVERGDVFWSIDPQGCDTQLAFLRGAAGVVCGRPVEPWPGTFSLRVDDAVEALSRVVESLQAVAAPPQEPTAADLEPAALAETPAAAGAPQESFHEIEELKVLQLPAVTGIANFPHTCGQSVEKPGAASCRRAA
jgi:hypothetical protein